MSSPHRRAALFASAVLFAAAAAARALPGASSAKALQGGRIDLSPLVVHAADADRGGSVEAAEWSAFTASLAADESGRLDREAVRARVVAYAWERDGDGKVTAADLVALFAGADADQNGALALAELGTGGAISGYAEFMAGAILVAAADRQGDWEVDQSEWGALVTEALGSSEMADADFGEVPDLAALAELDPAVVAAILARVESMPPPEDPNSVTPSVYLLTLSSALDSDFDGSLTLADLERTFARCDANSDGSASAEELGPRRAGPSAVQTDAQGGPGEGGPEPMPEREPAIAWQRNLDDALALVERTGKPLLVCVNMDGETASESFARGRYRDPEFAALVAGFVPVIVSPDTHSEREHDDRGRRLPDPRFGRVIESEHKDIEPIVFERYFDNKAVAPRHIAIAPSGEKLFDVFLVDDLSIVDRALAEKGVFGVELPDPNGLAVAELLDSPDAGCRDRLESLFADGDEAVRRELAGACLSAERATQQPELLRLALRDESADVRLDAARAAALHIAAVPAELLPDVFRAAEADGATLEQVGAAAVQRVAEEGVDEAWRASADGLVTLYAGLRAEAQVLDAERWRLALALAPRIAAQAPVATRESKAQAIALIERAEALLAERGADAELELCFAEALLGFARLVLAEGSNPTYLFEDARAAAQRALAAADAEQPDGEAEARARALLAWTSWMLGEPESAVAHAKAALPGLLPYAGTLLARQALEVLALGLRSGASADAASFADARAAFELLLAHPAPEERDVVAYAAFLRDVGARTLEAATLARVLPLFPTSEKLHAAFRAQVLRDGGAAALEEAYASIETAPGAEAELAWYAGLAALVAAERHVQNRERDDALAAYQLSVERFRESFAARPDYSGSAQHYVALALSGSANVLLERERLDAALESLREGIAASPSSASSPDGLGNTPTEVARRVHRALVRSGRASDASALRDELDGQGVKLGG